jgi:hypothetical protein
MGMKEQDFKAVVASWAPGPNSLAQVPDEKGNIAGFWRGFWHGLIAPITFAISVFNPNVHVYEVHNNGRAYNLGFLLGVMSSLGGSRGVHLQREED